MSLIGTDNYFEDFTVGDRFRHARGKTITDVDTMTVAQLVLNTSDGHYNTHKMLDSEFGAPPTFGGVVAAIVYGLASQDTAEQAISELGIDHIGFVHPTRTGDTLHAVSEVLEVKRWDKASGEVVFLHTGVNQDGKSVCELRRRVLLKTRPDQVR